MLPRGTLASAPHARTAHDRSAVRARSLSDYVLPCGRSGYAKNPQTGTPPVPRSSMRSSYPACRLSAEFVARDVYTCTCVCEQARARSLDPD